MCCCGTQNINGTPGYSWDGKSFGTYPTMPPTLTEGDTLLFDEPGRCGGIDSHSHHYRVVKNCGFFLLFRHGGGEGRIRLSNPRALNFEAMDSNTRYWIMNAIFHAQNDARREGLSEASQEYRQAFAEGRLKKRKMPKSSGVKVWIEPKVSA